MKTGIYYIQNINNSKLYVGSAVNILERWRLHKLHLVKGDHCSWHLQSAWNKYGEDSFIFGVLEYVADKKMLLEREQYWIDLHESFKREKGYNLAPIAGSSLGIKRSEETKKNMKNCFVKGMTPWNKGKKMEGEYKSNYLKAMRSDKMKGVRRKKGTFRQTEEAKKKISEAMSKRTLTEETKKKMSIAMSGKKLGEEHRLNCIKAWQIRKLKNKKEK